MSFTSLRRCIELISGSKPSPPVASPMSSVSQRIQWTEEEVSLYEQAVATVDTTSETFLEEIAERIPGKTVTQVAKRYYAPRDAAGNDRQSSQPGKQTMPDQSSLKTDYRRSKKTCRRSRYWTTREHRLFLEGLSLFGRGSWQRISGHIGTKTYWQVMLHGNKFYSHIKNPKGSTVPQGLFDLQTVADCDRLISIEDPKKGQGSNLSLPDGKLRPRSSVNLATPPGFPPIRDPQSSMDCRQSVGESSSQSGRILYKRKLHSADYSSKRVPAPHLKVSGSSLPPSASNTRLQAPKGKMFPSLLSAIPVPQPTQNKVSLALSSFWWGKHQSGLQNASDNSWPNLQTTISGCGVTSERNAECEAVKTNVPGSEGSKSGAQPQANHQIRDGEGPINDQSDGDDFFGELVKHDHFNSCYPVYGELDVYRRCVENMPGMSGTLQKEGNGPESRQKRQYRRKSKSVKSFY